MKKDEKAKKEMLKRLEEMKKEVKEKGKTKAGAKKTKKGTKKDFKLLSEFLAKRDARIIQDYAEMIVEKFGKYIKAVWVVGSVKTGRGKQRTSDIDVPVIVDDTDVRRMTRSELKEKLFQRLVEMGYHIDKRIHPQAYLLTEFWQYVREGNPVLMTMIRDGAIVYDTGFLLPVKMLLLKGFVKPSKEAVDKLIITASELVELTKQSILQKLTHNIHLAAVSASQAVLMELGYRPTTPKETPAFVEDILFKKHKYITKEEAEVCRGLVMTYKGIEHLEIKEYSGSELEKLLSDAEKYIKKMKEILKKLRKEKGESYLFELFDKKEELEMRRDGMLSPVKDEKIVDKTEELIKKNLGHR